MFQFSFSGLLLQTFEMNIFNSYKLTYLGVLLYLLFYTSNAESRQTSTPAHILAKQTGATQFKEDRYETQSGCKNHKHILKKRASDEDIDYEVYQGVVGRPGIDFPIYPRIPKTSFSCRSFGNGYFADMDTDCQVFHICEEGRKISFLCPNGTIFQQSELTCDWWFKVNCLVSSGLYAESAEILTKQRHHQVRPSVPVKGFSIIGRGVDIKPTIPKLQKRPVHPKKLDRRIDSVEQHTFGETIDFDDMSGEQLHKERAGVITKNNTNSENSEYQVGLDTTSTESAGKQTKNTWNNSNTKNKSNKSKKDCIYPNASPESFERPRIKYQDPALITHDQSEKGEVKERNTSKESEIINGQLSGQSRERVTERTRSANKISRSKQRIGETSAEQIGKTELNNRVYHATEKSESSELQSKARKQDSTRTTPFYTPTVPSFSKNRKSGSKSFYTKNKGSKITPTTLAPNQINDYEGLAVMFTEHALFPKTSNSFKENDKEGLLRTTNKPLVIGMRHNQVIETHSTERYRFSNELKAPIQPKNIEMTKAQNNRFKQQDTMTTPATTGPTYLPQIGLLSSINKYGASSDFQLLAPYLASNGFVSRNLDEMLKAMNLLKNKIETADKIEVKSTVPGRSGLDIPPSSGPDVLISFAKYFASEQNASNINSFHDTHNYKQGRQKHNLFETPFNSTTVSIPIAATPQIEVNPGDVKPSLLSERTLDRYTSLFGLNQIEKRKSSYDSHLNEAKSSIPYKDSNDSLPHTGTSDSTWRELAENPNSKKLARVFSNGLSKFLEDPAKFRQELTAIRPTKPPLDALDDFTPNFTPVKTKDKGLFRAGTAATYLPTKPTPSVGLSTTERNIASEVNKKFKYSSELPYFTSTSLVDSTTFMPLEATRKQRYELELSGELSPAYSESGEGEELLHLEQTQSFINSGSKISSEQLSNIKSNVSNSYLSVAKPTENPRNGISQTDFFDPLTINDGLMKESNLITSIRSTHSTTQRIRPKPQNMGLRAASAEVTTQSNSGETDSRRDILQSFDLPVSALPSNNGLQRIANRLFGGLNESEALHLKNVMQQAEHDRQVLSLLLLLIQTCDDNNGKALERSRKHLLSALIDMDSRLSNKQQVKSPHHDATTKSTPTESPLGKTHNKKQFESTTQHPFHSTATDLQTTAATLSKRLEETTKFQIRVEDSNSDQISTSSAKSSMNSNLSSDMRALELLKSLYSLASKFASRR